ncbi:glycosyltransferase [Falsiroseomonas sp.]|uniref:glycosyltransferase n=1 Tax=Falsiroseomonas sp. TaxID=2870721 RepID=UPI003568F648
MDRAREPLAEAEARRAAGDWRGAAAAYAAHLARAPEDWAIWVQHGHCVKEAGDPSAALDSYRRAEAGLPGDADLQLQIGHALKLAGDLAGAREAYAAALELDPSGDAAWQELTALRDPAAGLPAEQPAGLSLIGDLRVVFDLSDLMSWFGSARAPSGIQRVQMELAGAALARDIGLAEARLAVFRPATGSWRELPREAFLRLAALARAGADPLDPAWTATRAAAEAMLEAAPDLAFPQGAWLVNPGSSWWLAGYHQAVREARARHGLRYAALVHDTGPVSIPEHSEPAVSARFARWFSAVGTQADLVLAISEATRQDVERLAAERLPGLPFAPVQVLRPDAALPPPPAAAPHPRAATLAGEPYILFVGTIESRKDHLFVLNAWLELLRRHGEAVPRLVLVGRAGFNAGPALALLQRAPALEGRVLWLDDVADGALAALYRGALFTVYHSRHEGWGLPVTEALAAGKAVVAPAHSGLLEAGQGLALHVAPGSEPDFLAMIEKLLFEPGFRTATEARIATGLRLRSWRAVAEELIAALDSAPAGPSSPPPAPPLGLVHRLAEIEAPRPEPAMAWAELLRAGPAWHAPEPWGCWTRPGRALLRLPVPETRSGPLRLHIALRGAAAARRVTLRAGRGPRRLLELAAESRPVVVLDLPAPAAVAELAIEADPPSDDPVPGIGVGVVALMACAPEDVAARLGFLERLTFTWPEPA